MRDDRSPKKESQEGRRYNDTLDEEEDAELLDGHACENCLKDPVDELWSGQREYRDSISALTKQSNWADVIPALSGRWLGKFSKLGQIAVMQF